MEKKIKVLVAILGIDQHEVGAITISHHLRDAGMEVVYGGRFNLPPKIIKMAMEEDVDVIGLSCHSWEYLYYVPEIIGLLREAEMNIPVVVGGSVITAEDERKMLEQGVRAAFGPASKPDEIVQAIARMV